MKIKTENVRCRIRRKYFKKTLLWISGSESVVLRVFGLTDFFKWVGAWSLSSSINLKLLSNNDYFTIIRFLKLIIYRSLWVIGGWVSGWNEHQCLSKKKVRTRLSWQRLHRSRARLITHAAVVISRRTATGAHETPKTVKLWTFTLKGSERGLQSFGGWTFVVYGLPSFSYTLKVNICLWKESIVRTLKHGLDVVFIAENDYVTRIWRSDVVPKLCRFYCTQLWQYAC